MTSHTHAPTRPNVECRGVVVNCVEGVEVGVSRALQGVRETGHETAPRWRSLCEVVGVTVLESLIGVSICVNVTL